MWTYRRQDRDAQSAIRLAEHMILDGRMPSPEDAEEQLQERLRPRCERLVATPAAAAKRFLFAAGAGLAISGARPFDR